MAALPLRVGARLLGLLTVGWEQAQEFGPADVQRMTVFAAQCAQALDRPSSGPEPRGGFPGRPAG